MIARGTGFVKGHPQAAKARLAAHLKYLEHRARTEQETRDDRRIFSKDENIVNRESAMRDVMEHTSASVRYHKMVLSPDHHEPVRDWHEWTRGVMSDLEQKQGRELHWYAVRHGNTDNPHVHVVLAGAGENKVSGKLEPVKMYQRDYELLRQSGMDRSDRDWYRQIEERLREEARQEKQEMTRFQERQLYQGGDRDR